jgi:succinoglycan biosynthesis transport protein ExoP
MLQRNTDHHPNRISIYGRRVATVAEAGQRSSEGEIDVLLNIFGCLRRNLKIVVAAAIVGTIVATVAAFMISPQYMSTVTIFVDPRQTKILQDAEVVGQLQIDAGTIESEVELVRSDAVMREVARRLDLANDEEDSSVRSNL